MPGAVSPPVLAVERDAEGVAYAAAHSFWQSVDAALTERPSFRVALAGGRTPAGMYHELVRQRPGGAVWHGFILPAYDEMIKNGLLAWCM